MEVEGSAAEVFRRLVAGGTAPELPVGGVFFVLLFFTGEAMRLRYHPFCRKICIGGRIRGIQPLAEEEPSRRRDVPHAAAFYRVHAVVSEGPRNLDEH